MPLQFDKEEESMPNKKEYSDLCLVETFSEDCRDDDEQQSFPTSSQQHQNVRRNRRPCLARLFLWVVGVLAGVIVVLSLRDSPPPSSLPNTNTATTTTNASSSWHWEPQDEFSWTTTFSATHNPPNNNKGVYEPQFLSADGSVILLVDAHGRDNVDQADGGSIHLVVGGAPYDARFRWPLHSPAAALGPFVRERKIPTTTVVHGKGGIVAVAETAAINPPPRSNDGALSSLVVHRTSNNWVTYETHYLYNINTRDEQHVYPMVNSRILAIDVHDDHIAVLVHQVTWYETNQFITTQKVILLAYQSDMEMFDEVASWVVQGPVNNTMTAPSTTATNPRRRLAFVPPRRMAVLLDDRIALYRQDDEDNQIWHKLDDDQSPGQSCTAPCGLLLAKQRQALVVACHDQTAFWNYQLSGWQGTEMGPPGIPLAVDGNVLVVVNPRDATTASEDHLVTWIYDFPVWIQDPTLDKSGMGASLAANGTLLATTVPTKDGTWQVQLYHLVQD